MTNQDSKNQPTNRKESELEEPSTFIDFKTVIDQPIKETIKDLSKQVKIYGDNKI